MSRRTKVFSYDQAHKGKVSGVCFGQEGRLLSCGVDRNIKLWNTEGSLDDENGAGPSQVSLVHSHAYLSILKVARRGNRSAYSLASPPSSTSMFLLFLELCRPTSD